MKWLPLFVKRYASTLLSLLLVVALGGIWWHGYTTGQARAEAAQLRAIEVLRDRAATLADELEVARGERKIEYRDRIRTVYREPDPSGCADVAVPDGVLRALRDATGQPTDGGVRATRPARGDES